jgi:nucleoside-diphosphate-sugar epimerase
MSEFARALADRRVVLGATGFIGRWWRAGSRAGARCGSGATPGGGRSGRMRHRRHDRAGGRARADDLAASTATCVGITCNLIGYGVDRRETDALAEAINVDLVRRLRDLVPAAAAGSDWPGLHLVHTGSALEYGAIGGHLAEDAVVNPTTVYGQTKLAATRLVESAVVAGTLRAVTARLFTVYGPGEHDGRLLPSILSARSSTSPVPMTNGLQQRDFTYVGDVAEGLIRAALQPTVPWSTVNLATGHLHTVRDFVTRAEAALGLTPGRFQFGALPTRAEEMAHAAVTVERARTGWAGCRPPELPRAWPPPTRSWRRCRRRGPLTRKMALDLLTRNTMRFSLSAHHLDGHPRSRRAHYEEHGFFMVEGGRA